MTLPALTRLLRDLPRYQPQDVAREYRSPRDEHAKASPLVGVWREENSILKWSDVAALLTDLDAQQDEGRPMHTPVKPIDGMPDDSWRDEHLLNLLYQMPTSIMTVSGDLARGFKRSDIHDDGTVFGYAADPEWLHGVAERIERAAGIVRTRFRALAASPTSDAAPPAEIAWLIGRVGPQWWTGRGDEWTVSVDGTTLNPTLCAIRFANRESAERAIGYLIPKEHREFCQAEEHIWG